MKEFITYRAYDIFRRHILQESRYFLDKTSQSFFEVLLETSKARRHKLSAGSNFWRAQQGHDWITMRQDDEEIEIPGPHLQERMRPRENIAMEGRANPKGIPYLYVASDKETAMAEVRPSVGDYVSVGQFKTLRDVSILDCSKGHDSGINLYFEEPDSDEREKAVWNDIDRAFSEPVRADDDRAEYAPTQIISEFFRNEGLDGIIYKSNLGEGFNLALFDIQAADIINCFLFQVKSISYKFEEASNPYFISKYYEQKNQE